MVHQFGNEELSAFREVNVQGTRNLLESAITRGVRRFILISTIKVNGEDSIAAEPITADSPVNPRGAYAQSKWEAEQVVSEVGSNSGIEIVIIRPVLVYGPRVGANFLRLLSLVRSGLPLPFRTVKNLRSILYIDNLCDLVELCTHHEKAGNEIFLAADATPISTPDLIRSLANAMNRSPRLFSIPPRILEGVSAIVNRGSQVRRLTGSLVASIDKNEALLDWVPPVTTEEGLARTVKSFVQQRENG
jgi:nucleoside-diphosphate-sugar epimerase